jgi:5-methylcytosine-specific restriction endonuclease McrA
MDPSIEPEAGTALRDPTLVLNRSWSPVHVTTVRRALAMLCRGSVAVLDPESLSPLGAESWFDRPVDLGDRAVRTPSRLILAPEIILLGRYDRLPVTQAPFTRVSLLRRDDHRCQYCGTRPPHAQLTIDHVVPRARGGQTSWENCVAACVRCNSRKGDRPASHVGLRLLRPPRAPRWTPCFQMQPGAWPASWRPFLPEARRPSTGT